jgi:hypothetical protein
VHSKFGGDGKDHAKGFVLASLYERIPGLDLRVDPMFSDAPLATGSDGLNAYCRFLRIPPNRVVNNDQQYRGLYPVNRNGQGQWEDYFQPHYDQEYDLFLDPDTGFGVRSSRHVPWSILPRLVPPKSSRVLAVFQSRHRESAFEQNFIDRHLSAYDCFWVDLGQQAYILFVGARDNPRLALFRQALENAYHPHEAIRVITVSCSPAAFGGVTAR